MLLAAGLALALQTVAGLREGESATARAALAGEFGAPAADGRLLHAFSGAPIVGAEIEVWMEIGSLARGPVASGTSLADGSFRIAHPGVLRVDKLLIRAEGFRSTTVGSADAQDLLMWPQASHLALRVVDLEGKPIAKAVAETRQTCAHAPPAYRGESDADGRFDLAQFPPLEDEPEIVVTAAGYGAMLLQLPEQMLAPGGLEVRLPRRPGIAFTVVDRGGAPSADRRVCLGVEPHWLAGATDKRGRIEFASVFFRREALVTVVTEGGGTWLADSGLAPSDVEPRYVLPRETQSEISGAPGVSEPLERGRKRPIPSDRLVRVKLVDAEGRAVDAPLRALHPDGSDMPGDLELDLEWGPTTLIAGGAFSGWNESVRLLDKPGDTTLQLVKEPLLSIELPDGYWTVHVQCRDDSVTLEGPDLPLKQPVPAGGPLIVCAVSETQTRLVRVPRIVADAGVDLRADECVVAERVVGDAFSHITLHVPEAKLAGHVRTSRGWLDPSGLPDEFRFEIQTGANFEGVMGAPGRLKRALGPTAEALVAESAKLHDLPRLGSLRVRGALLALHAGGAEGEAVAASEFLVEDIAPGPLLAQVQLEDGRVLDLSLVLNDGERRELRIEGAR